MASIWRNKANSTRPVAIGPAADDLLAAPPSGGRNLTRKAPTVVRLVPPEPPLDTLHAPAVRAFLADRLDGMTDQQRALARAVSLARQVC